ncbi:MAG: BrnA antitoxin family protein [Caldilineaceae bacterium]|nr:BrnA antitoxin family protein [Caldilineaceae bacterium]
MRDEYDFSNSKPNPYAQKLRRPVTIRLGVDVIDYFRTQAEETGIPYQTLINLYLKDCVRTQRKLEMQWAD